MQSQDLFRGAQLEPPQCIEQDAFACRHAVAELEARSFELLEKGGGPQGHGFLSRRIGWARLLSALVCATREVGAVPSSRMASAAKRAASMAAILSGGRGLGVQLPTGVGR